MEMSQKKGKDLATSIILEDLLGNESSPALPISEKQTTSETVKNDLTIKEEFKKQQNTQPLFKLKNKEQELGTATMATPHQDKTVQLDVTQMNKPKEEKSSFVIEDQVRQSVGRFATHRGGRGGVNTATVASLAQSENLKLAQQRIIELEKSLEKVREDNIQLVTAGDLMRKKADELMARLESLEAKYQLDLSSFKDEKELLKATLSSRDQEMNRLKSQIDEMELRLSSTVQKVRVRERELENRLELVKMENAALIQNKDEFILELKRQIDQLNMELDNFRNKGQELNRQLTDKQEMLKRTVKALRIALTMLEGAEDTVNKKAK